MQRLRPLLSLVLLPLWLLGCRDEVQPKEDLAVHDSFVVDASACTLLKAYSSSNGKCNACAQATCCTEVNACYGATSCDDDYTDCYLACALLPEPDAGASGLAACLAACTKQFPAGGALFDAAIGCVDKRCVTECK